MLDDRKQTEAKRLAENPEKGCWQSKLMTALAIRNLHIELAEQSKSEKEREIYFNTFTERNEQ